MISSWTCLIKDNSSNIQNDLPCVAIASSLSFTTMSCTGTTGRGLRPCALSPRIDCHDSPSSNEIYITGRTEGSLDSNNNLGSYDGFLVKYNSSGKKQWTKQFGTSSTDWANGVAIDSSGNIVVTGYTDGSLDGNSNSGGSDLFLLKFNSSGTKQ